MKDIAKILLIISFSINALNATPILDSLDEDYIDIINPFKIDKDVEIENESGNKPYLILISFDGFRWDYLQNYSLPNIKKYFVEDGAMLEKGLTNAFSTVTFPNHWTLATGLYPESHGIVANVMYDPTLNQTYYDYGKLDNDTHWYAQNNLTVPIWTLNELENNRRSAIVGGFPGANVPFLNKTVSYTLDYENKLQWFRKVDYLIDFFVKDDINFGTLYIPEPDETGHTYGPYSKNLENTLFKCDLLVGYLIERLKEESLFEKMNIIITSDHGMDTASLDHSIDLSDYVDIKKFKSYGGLTEISIFPNDPKDTDEIYKALKNIPHYNVYKKEDIPSHLIYKNNVRIGPIIMYGDVGYEIFRTNRTKFDWDHWKGDHGGDNRNSSMHPVFVSRGPLFKEGFVLKSDHQVNSVDVYTLMCFVLNLKPISKNNGSFVNIKHLLKPEYVGLSVIDKAKTHAITAQHFRKYIINMVSDLDNKLKTNLNVLVLLFILFGFILFIQFYFTNNKHNLIRTEQNVQLIPQDNMEKFK